MASCTSPLARNRTFGVHLGRGLSVKEATATTRQTTKGIKSAEAVLDLARTRGVEMPIAEVISALLIDKITLDEAVAALMQRPPKPERRPPAALQPRRADRPRSAGGGASYTDQLGHSYRSQLPRSDATGTGFQEADPAVLSAVGGFRIGRGARAGESGRGGKSKLRAATRTPDVTPRKACAAVCGQPRWLLPPPSRRR